MTTNSTIDACRNKHDGIKAHGSLKLTLAEGEERGEHGYHAFLCTLYAFYFTIPTLLLRLCHRESKRDIIRAETLYVRAELLETCFSTLKMRDSSISGINLHCIFPHRNKRT